MGSGRLYILNALLAGCGSDCGLVRRDGSTAQAERPTSAPNAVRCRATQRYDRSIVRGRRLAIAAGIAPNGRSRRSGATAAPADLIAPEGVRRCHDANRSFG